MKSKFIKNSYQYLVGFYIIINIYIFNSLILLLIKRYL